MEYRGLGATGLNVSRLGIGLAALGRPGYITLGHASDFAGGREVEAMSWQTHKVLDAAWELGIRYVDAARSYGRAEEFLAGWISSRGVGSAPLVVASKWGYTYAAGWRTTAEQHEVKDHSLATLNRQYGESRAILGAWLRLYQIHSATLASGVLNKPDVLDRLAALKRQTGLLIGLTLSGPESWSVLVRATGVERDGRPLFDVVQATWNLLEPSLAALLFQAHQSGMGVVVKEALANGRLTDRNDDPAFAGKRFILEREASRLGCTIDQLALAAVLERPWADIVLSGASTPVQLRSNVAALNVRFDAQAREALSWLAEPVEQYWETRSRLPWN
ncbi:MAG TPA: aldo/keto reductase [Thermomicrobiales bacterium]|nr:aldo/keto reductase [Thermomicrobiales bacterium]